MVEENKHMINPTPTENGEVALRKERQALAARIKNAPELAKVFVSYLSYWLQGERIGYEMAKEMLVTDDRVRNAALQKHGRVEIIVELLKELEK